MIYKSTSIRDVIGRVIRNTRLQDTSFIADMHVWIPEAMGLMKTKTVLASRYRDVPIVFNIGELPADLDHITAVAYGTQRLSQVSNPRGTTGFPRIAGNLTYRQQVSMTISQEGPVAYQSIVTANDDCLTLPMCQGHWYDIEMGYIRTSVPDCSLRVFYKGIPLDEDGLPLIPDQEDYKQAIYWYVRAMMIGAGFEDRIFSYQYCNDKFELHAARAISSIRYPTVDSMEMKAANLNRLVKIPGDYFNSFFGTDYNSSGSELTTATTPLPISNTTLITEV